MRQDIQVHLNLKWMIFNAWLILTACDFFNRYSGWIFSYLLFFPKKFASAWLLEILTFYYTLSYLEHSFQLFFLLFTLHPCSHLHLLSFCKATFLFIYLVCRSSLWTFSPSLEYRLGPLFHTFDLKKFKASSILKSQRSSTEVASLNSLRLVALKHWSFSSQDLLHYFLEGFYPVFQLSLLLWN